MRRITSAVLAAALLLAACGGPTEGLFGQELYDLSCASCHARDGSGGAGLPLGPESNSVRLSDEQLQGAIVVGPGTMPSFSRLDDAQVDSLVVYIRQLQNP